MYNQTKAQFDAERELNRSGFKFSNWIPAHPDAENEPVEGTAHQGCMVMVKQVSRHSREYREIEPDGTIN